MAPVCVARRLTLPAVLVFMLILTIVPSNLNSLLCYDHQALLKIKLSVDTLVKFDLNGQGSPPPPLLSDVPYRRHGKRSGSLVKIKAYLALRQNRLHCYPSLHDATCRRRPSWRVLDPVGTWLVPVVSPDEETHPPRPCLPRRCRGGVDHRHLRPLARATQTADVPAPIRCALVNARSIVNKTFILKDYFTSQNLDLLFVTETWLSVGESAALSELLPLGCTYFNSPRTTGRGGGVAVILKENLSCKLLSRLSFSSFELCMFELGRTSPIPCAVIYQLPKYNKDFIHEFSDFLTGLMPNYDSILIVGDLNVHVCCPQKPLAKDFINLIEAFNLEQHVTGPTQEHGHTLDLILSCGLITSNVLICDAVFSDHMPVLFEFASPCLVNKPCAAARRCRMVNPGTAAQFSSAFYATMSGSVSPLDTNTEGLTSSFLTTCNNIIDCVAPLKTMRPKPKSEPWLNDVTLLRGVNAGELNASGRKTNSMFLMIS